jgi:RNA polymerase sigma-70 factor, ECF subfamily
MVHGILLAGVPPQEAEDLLQDVFMIALERLGELREPGAFGPWLAAIARNHGADHHRRARETLDLPADLEAPRDVRGPEVEQLLGVVRSMPEAYRETLILRFVEGMTGPEIAERTGLAPDSVRVNLHRGVKLLRQRLGLGDPA